VGLVYPSRPNATVLMSRYLPIKQLQLLGLPDRGKAVLWNCWCASTSLRVAGYVSFFIYCHLLLLFGYH
jgi:hypothetical protein